MHSTTGAEVVDRANPFRKTEQETMSNLELTVLASEAGRSSGYALSHGDTTVLVDCGPGVIRALESHCDPSSLAAVVITHEHADHSIDLVGLAFRLRYPTAHAIKIPLYLPEDMIHMVDRLDDLLGAPTIGQLSRPIRDSFDVRPLDLRSRTRVDITPELSLTPFSARHAVASAALRFETSQAAVAFSSDTGPTQSLVEAAEHADYFVCEATYGATQPHTNDLHGHLTAGQAGDIARQAEVGTLLLSHLSRPTDAEASVEAAATHYTGSIRVASRGAHFSTEVDYVHA